MRPSTKKLLASRRFIKNVTHRPLSCWVEHVHDEALLLGQTFSRKGDRHVNLSVRGIDKPCNPQTGVVSERSEWDNFEDSKFAGTVLIGQIFVLLARVPLTTSVDYWFYRGRSTSMDKLDSVGNMRDAKVCSRPSTQDVLYGVWV